MSKFKTINNMETNQNPVQENPAQLISPETIATVQPEQQSVLSTEQPTGQLPLEPQPEEPARLYNPAEAAQIVKCLTDDYFAPEYILLFGKLVGGTRHSDATTYDLLMVVREAPDYDWMRAKRILRYKVPIKRREITYVNLYIMTLNYVQSNNTPFLYFAHKEGELLYCSDHYHFRRPKYPVNFAAAYADAKLHYDTFRMLGNEFIEQSHHEFSENRNWRLAALFSAQAAVYFYHTLYYVYHGQEFDSHDPVIMHERMRTLSTKLMLVFDDTHVERIYTLPCLKLFLHRARYDLKFNIMPQELEMHMQRVEKMGEIIEQCAGLRLELYKELSERQ